MAKAPKVEADPDAAKYASRELPKLISKYFSTVRKALAKNPSPPELHRLRLATKHVRYTLELFRSCYGPGLESRIDELRDVQQILGEINDCAATVRLLKTMPASPDRKQSVAFLDAQADRKAHLFRTQWTEKFDAPGRERWWVTYLERQATAS